MFTDLYLKMSKNSENDDWVDSATTKKVTEKVFVFKKKAKQATWNLPENTRENSIAT